MSLIPQVLKNIFVFGARTTGRGAMATGRGIASLSRGAVGLAKTVMIAKLASSMSKVDDASLNAVDSDIDTLGQAYESPIKKSEIIKVDVSDATLKFSEYVNKETSDVRPIRALGRPLPELIVSRKYSSIIKDIIENINGIKKRLESVEIKTHKQTAILLRLRAASMGLNETVKDAIDTDRQNELQLKRDDAEEQIERRGIGNVASDVFGKLRDYAENTGSLVKEYITKFGLPLALIALPSLIPDSDPDTKLEDLYNAARDIITKVTTGTSAALGAAVATTGRAKRIVSSFSGRRQNLRALQAMRAAREYFSDLRNSQNRIAQQVNRAATAMPRPIQRALNYALRAPARLFKGMVAIEGMMVIAEFYFGGVMTEQERDKQMKEKIGDLVRFIGIPWLLAFIFGSIGAPTGIGALIGAAAGFLAGVLLGDAAYKIFGLEKQIDGLYDAFVHGNWSKLMSVQGEILAEMPGIIGEMISDAMKNAVQKLDDIMVPVKTISEEQLEFRFGKGAAGASAADIIFRSSQDRMKGHTAVSYTDQDAILFAFKNVDTPEKYHSIKQNFEEEFLPTYNKIEGEENAVETMEEYLDKELSTKQYNFIKDHLQTQVLNNDSVSDEEYKKFLTDIDYDTRKLAVRMTAEEYNLIQQGEAVTVQLLGGAVEVMTEEKILQADNITEEVRREALERLQNSSNLNVIPQESINNPGLISLPQPRNSTNNYQNPSPTSYGTMGPTAMNMSGGSQTVSPSSPSPTISTTDPFIDVRYVT